MTGLTPVGIRPTPGPHTFRPQGPRFAADDAQPPAGQPPARKRAAKAVTKLEHPMATSPNTVMFHEKDYRYNAPHHFVVRQRKPDNPDSARGKVLTRVDFQEGPIKEVGVNGLQNEDLLAMVIRRLEGFQASPFACNENAMALQKVEEAMMWLKRRTAGREQRGVEGTNRQ
jgi:hypothetical protein